MQRSGAINFQPTKHNDQRNKYQIFSRSKSTKLLERRGTEMVFSVVDVMQILTESVDVAALLAKTQTTPKNRRK